MTSTSFVNELQQHWGNFSSELQDQLATILAGERSKSEFIALMK